MEAGVGAGAIGSRDEPDCKRCACSRERRIVGNGQANGHRHQALALQPGDASIQLAGESRALRNTGTSPIELVEIELK